MRRILRSALTATLALHIGAACDQPASGQANLPPSIAALQRAASGTDPFVVLRDSAAVSERRPGMPDPELPQVYLNTAMPTVAGHTIRLGPRDDLQEAIDAARPGDVLVLAPGAIFEGPFVLPRKAGGDGWIVIRSGGTLPPEGTRVTPADAGQMPKLVSARPNEPVIATEAGARRYRLVGLEVTAKPDARRASTLVALGSGNGAKQNMMAQQPHDLVLDRVYVHGTPTLNFQRCIGLNSGTTAIVDSWISECHGKGFDSQAIGGWNGTGPYKIVNNHLAGAGENVLFGGADPAIPGALPRDIEFRRNHVYKPKAWQGVWSVKNAFELKIGQRVLVEGNVFENVWPDAQTGFAFVIKSTNQGGDAPWSETSDVTVRYNVIRNSAHGVVLSGKPESHPAVPASRMTFAHNVFERIGTGDYPGGRLFQIAGIADLTIEHNTAASAHSALILTGEPPMRRLVVRNNVFAGATIGVAGDGKGSGTNAFEGRAERGWVFAGNVVAGVQARQYPPGNSYPRTVSLPPLAALAPPASEAAPEPVVDPKMRPRDSRAGADYDWVAAMVRGVVVDP